MIKVYGSVLCAKTRDYRYNLDKNNIPYEFIDINDSLKNMKDFLAIRDSSDKFDRIKEQGGIGLPTTILEDGSIVIRWNKYLEDMGIEVKFLREVCEDGKENC